MPSARANLPLLFVGQAAKETTVNTALTILEALSVGGVKSQTVASPPAMPAEGDTYVVPATGTTGVFIGQENKIAHWYNAAWKFYTPQNGWNVRVIDEDYSAIAFNGTVWIEAAGGSNSSAPLASPTDSGTVKTDLVSEDPVVYLKTTTDTLLANKEPTITTLPVGKGGSGLSTIPKNLQVLLGNNDGTGYELVTLTAGANVTLTRNQGNLTFAASPGQTAAPTPIASNTVTGTVKTDVNSTDPFVYTIPTIDSLLANKEPKFTVLPINKGGTGNDATPTNGQILIGNGAGYSVANLTAGSNITITNTAGNITIASTGGGSSAQTRETVTFTTPVLAPQEKLDFDALLGKRHNILAIKTNVPAWVRTYPNAAYRLNDTNRSINEQPPNDYVAFVDVVTTSTALETFIIPNAACSSMEATPSSSIKCTVVNLSSVSNAITIEFVVVKTEP